MLTWRPRPRRFFKSDRDCSAWNSNFANKPFGGISWWGYIQGHCLGGKYFAHTLLFLWMRGRWPVGIDHDDRDRTNNRWKNLIEAGALANSRNIRRKKERVGVYRVGKRFIATIKVSGKRIRLGLFGSYGEAVAARIRAEKKYGFRNG